MSYLGSQRGVHRYGTVIGALVVLLLTPTCASSFSSPKRTTLVGQWGIKSHRIDLDMPCVSRWHVVHSLRAGSTVEEDEGGAYDEEDEYDDDEDEVNDEDESSSDEEEEEADDAESEEVEPNVDEEESTSITEYDEQLLPPPGLQMGSLLGVMLLSRRLDFFNPKVVRFARFIFIAYVILHQAFCVYVRIMAKLNNDKTPIVTTNPLSGLVNSQLGQNGGDIVKDLASQFLSSTSTVMEYDLKQVKSMIGSLLFNMAFMWFLHFKMEQTQPLLAQTLTGTLNLVYHPLFQVYVLGRNLKRPFNNPATKAHTGEEDTESTNEIETETQVNADDDEEEADEVDASEDESSSDDDDKTSDDDDDDDEEETNGEGDGEGDGDGEDDEDDEDDDEE